MHINNFTYFFFYDKINISISVLCYLYITSCILDNSMNSLYYDLY